MSFISEIVPLSDLILEYDILICIHSGRWYVKSLPSPSLSPILESRTGEEANVVTSTLDLSDKNDDNNDSDNYDVIFCLIPLTKYRGEEG